MAARLIIMNYDQETVPGLLWTLRALKFQPIVTIFYGYILSGIKEFSTL